MKTIDKFIYLNLTLIHLTAVIICFFMLKILSSQVEFWPAVIVTFLGAHLGFWVFSAGFIKLIQYLGKHHHYKTNYSRLVCLIASLAFLLIPIVSLIDAINSDNYDDTVVFVFTMPFWSLALFIAFNRTKWMKW